MKKLMLAAMVAAVMALGASAATEIVDGISWYYYLKDGDAVIGDHYNAAIPKTTKGEVVVPSRLGGAQVVFIDDYAFKGCSLITSVKIPTGVTVLGCGVFSECSSLKMVDIPEGMMYVYSETFGGCSSLKTAIFRGEPPSGLSQALLYNWPVSVFFPKGCGRKWFRSAELLQHFGGYLYEDKIDSRVLSAVIRDNDPTVMDVVYKVTSKKPTVKIRVLAFEDGERSFAKVVRPETFIDGTAENVGDAVTPNVEHKISWKVSSDWQTKLAKVKVEVLASEGELLPLETMTIPASDQYGKMKITWNAISYCQVFDALLWLYADKDPGLTLSGGVLRGNGVNLAKETELGHKRYEWSDEYWDFDYRVNAARYVLQKMGYSLLTGAPLTYANQETRLGLSPSGARQYGYKIVE